eukprot:gene3568-6303_t
MKKILRQSVRSYIKEGPRIPIPSAGKSSGDFELDEATKKWRSTNTVDDDKIQQLFEKQKKKGMSFDNFLDELDKQSQQQTTVKREAKSYRNEETGENNGPKGPEPTRFGDWEKNGRCYDF